jgi:TonB-dependent receptor-like protein/carboxypeptidase family protein
LTPRRLLLSIGIVVLVGSSSLMKTARAEAPRYAQRPLSEALEDLRSRGVHLIYSSDLVRPEMIVGSEPEAGEPRVILERLLAPFGLASADGPGGTVMVVPSGNPIPPPSGVSGIVRSQGDGRPVRKAQILVAGTEVRGWSGEDGAFGLLRVPPGRYTLEVKAPGLPQQRFPNVAVLPGKVTEVLLDLALLGTLRENIQVESGPAPPGGDQTEPRHSLTHDDLQRRSRLGDDVQRALAGSPGMVTADKSAALGVRGGDPSETLVLLDGLEIDEPVHLRDFLGFSSIIDARAVARADLLAGGFTAEYGDHFSGIVDLTTVDRDDADRTLVSTSLIDSALLTGGAFRDAEGGWLVSGRTWYPDSVLDVVDPGGEDISPTYHDVLAKFDLHGKDGSRLGGNVLATLESVDFVSDPGDDRVTSRNASQYAWIHFDAPWTERLYSRTLIFYGRVGRSRAGRTTVAETGMAQVRDERLFSSQGLRQEWLLQASGRSSLKWGTGAKWMNADYEYSSHSEGIAPLFGGGVPPATDRSMVLSPAGASYEAFLTHRMRWTPALTVETGVRWDAQTLQGQHQISPRLNLLFAPSERNALRAAWGRYAQSQAVSQLPVEEGESAFRGAEHGEHRLVGLDHFFGNGLALSVQAYSKTMWDVRPRYENLFNPIQIFPEVQPDRIRLAPSRANAKGVELLLSAERGRSFSWSASYALASAEDEIGGRWVPRSWDQRHAFNFNLSYRRGDSWSLDLAGAYHSGWPTTSVAATSATAPDGSATIVPVLGPRNAARFPAYQRLDLKAGKKFHLDHSTLTAFVEVTNLTGRDNVCCVESFRFTPRADETVQVDRREGFWLRQLPVAGLIWEFGR